MITSYLNVLLALVVAALFIGLVISIGLGVGYIAMHLIEKFKEDAK